MNTFLWIVLVIEMLFLLITVPIFLSFSHMRRKQEKFFRELHGSPDLRIRHTVLVTVYLAMTALLSVAIFLYYASHFLG